MTPHELAELTINFLALVATDRDFVKVWVQDPAEERAPEKGRPGKGIWTKDGQDIPCRVVALDDLGNYSVLTEAGQVRQFFAAEIL
jgi:hypothetical protein